ncbi:MAG: alanine racemase [Gammaproteobacteria bacterium]|jgi:alanine racemase|nr:alanine racemase [Gammaproteobacteria bacterium]
MLNPIPQAVIDLGALRHNLACARAAAPGRRVMAVVKANGYGHGLLRAARALSEADAFAVARVGEGVQLRDAGLGKRIVVLEGFFDERELAEAVRLGLDLVFHQPEQLGMLEAAHLDRPLRAWLKVDTGMHRLGFGLDDALSAFEALAAASLPAERPGLMTHFANADDPADPRTQAQLERFGPLAAQLRTTVSISNSAGILGWPQGHGDWVRPGLMLYGASPMLGGRAADHGLRPVMTLRSRVIAVNRYRRGDEIGYGGTYVCPEDMAVGVVAVGYGDGYPRHARSGTPVLVKGHRAPLVGRVSMDMISVDLRGVPEARVGDDVVLWGEGLPVEEIAEHAGTIPYELTCSITGRVAVIEADPETGMPGKGP